MAVGSVLIMVMCGVYTSTHVNIIRFLFQNGDSTRKTRRSFLLLRLSFGMIGFDRKCVFITLRTAVWLYACLCVYLQLSVVCCVSRYLAAIGQRGMW